jgi:hypothetical protein
MPYHKEIAAVMRALEASASAKLRDDMAPRCRP